MGDEEVEVEGAEEGEAVAGEIFRLEILPIDCLLFHICLLCSEERKQ